MTKIDEGFEARVAAHRGQTRQSKTTPWLIRDDGKLFPNVPLIAKKPTMRPYRGEVTDSLEKRMQYLRGVSGRRVINTAAVSDEEAPFDIAKASKDDLIKFAADEYGELIDPAEHLNKIRSTVAKLAGVEAKTIFNNKPGSAATAEGLQTPATA